ncbi:MAG: hypothetical protein IPH32_15635 [Bacteroidetes bacterium]|nr:hypothetical protein [Bacteroidota bacterium]
MVSPDGDGLNDNWLIENSENFPNNTVTILIDGEINFGLPITITRLMFGMKTQGGAILTSGTYFYIIEVRKRQ